MKASQLTAAIRFAIEHKLPLLIKGAPGTGKSDIIAQACSAAGAELIISHPVVSDPTDYKGLPFPVKDKAEASFLPFGDLLRLTQAQRPTVFFLDDLGQAPMSVQAACMQLILARQVNGHMVSDQVVFLAATNRRQDKAAVLGILEPVKSRFAGIIELEVDLDDWVSWAYAHNMPPELIAFVRYRPTLLHDFKPSADIVNSPSPRTVAYVGKMLNAGIPEGLEYELISGAAGEGFAAEFMGFLKLWESLPDIPAILADPDHAPLPTEPSVLFAVVGALVAKADRHNFASIMRYTRRLPGEFQVLLANDATRCKPLLANVPDFAQWAIEHQSLQL
ncbi:MAG: ATP-binding protein [Candidatus Cloacimonetes bacterium]|jgi:hypothetical protein|nr:ATP-binding protein [Candidatus Cloacimonadota bacterium]